MFAAFKFLETLVPSLQIQCKKGHGSKAGVPIENKDDLQLLVYSSTYSAYLHIYVP